MRAFLKFSGVALVALSLASVTTVAGAQAPAAPAGPTAVFKVNTAKVTMTEEASLPNHTVYRPVKLPSGKMPILVWGNSGCVKAGNSASPFLGGIAENGYLVIASGPIAPLDPTPIGVPPRITRAPNAPPPALDPATGRPAAQTADDLTKTSELGDAVTWAFEQNGKNGSPYFGKIDTAHVAVAGTSCGGLQAIEFAGSDARVKSLMVIASGLLDRPRVGANATEASLKAVKGPILYLSGGGANEGTATASKTDFNRVDAQPIFHGHQEAGYVAVTGENGGSWTPVATAWLNWQFKGDKTAAKQFQGASCGLCTKAGWTVQKKKID